MKTEKAIELILMPKVFYALKELKNKISIVFSFLSMYWKLENKPYYLAYARTVGSRSNRWLALGEIPEGLDREPFRINLDLSFGINFTSDLEFWPTIKNQALEFDHEPTVLP